MLILPGVLSDMLGLLLLIPPVRVAARKRLMTWFSRRFRIDASAAWRDPSARPIPGDKIIDARVIEARVAPD